MLLTLTTTHSPATDLGYLLHKHPAKVQSFTASFGEVHVFYPEASAERCTAALLLEVDPVGLVRKKGRSGKGFALQQYVNDRPYVASSFLSTAIVKVYRSALNGLCKQRPELVATPIPLLAKIAVLPCRGGESFLRALFEPLGYTVRAQSHPLDETFPEWGESPYFTVELEHTLRLSEFLTHLYVLIPVLDNHKHYWVGDEEVAKLLHRGGDWLATHPQRDKITAKYLKQQGVLTRAALAQLVADEDADLDASDAHHDEEERRTERTMGLHEQRLRAVLTVLQERHASRVLDLGCGEGKLLRLLLNDKRFTEIVGLDVSYRSLEMASERLHLDNLPDKQRERIRLMQGSLIYRDKRLVGYDAAAVVEVIEHLDAPRLAAFERVLFEFAQPGTVIITTPNSEYNVKWATLPAGQFRHQDHRFEWTRGEFQTWAKRVAEQYGYGVQIKGIGPEDASVGTPTQMAIFTK